MNFLRQLTTDKYAGFIFTAVVIVFGQALWFDFVWDDHIFIVDNDSIKSLTNLPYFFTQQVAGLYRPLRTTLYALMYALFGLHTLPYHALGLILHIAVSILVMRIIILFGFEEIPAFLSALIFAIHPVHIEKFIFVTSVFDIPGDLCLLLATYYFLKKKKGLDDNGLIKSVLIFGVGILFSETAVMFPFLALLLETFLTDEKKLTTKEKKSFTLQITILFVIYIIIRSYVVGRMQRPEANFEFFPLYMTMPVVFINYLKLLFIPYPLTVVTWIKVFENPINLLTVTSFTILISLILTGWKLHKKNEFITLGIFWFFIAIFPNANLIPTGNIMAERYLYIPSIGLSFLLATFIKNNGKRNYLATISFIFFLSLLSIIQTGYWKNDETLWKRNIITHPEARGTWQNLAVSYREKGETQKAKVLYKQMAKNGIQKERAISELAAFAIDEGKHALAERLIKPLLRIKPADKGLQGDLLIARCQQDENGWEKEATSYLKENENALIYEQVGNCYAKKRGFKKALAMFNHSISIAPDNTKVKENILIVESEIKKLKFKNNR